LRRPEAGRDRPGPVRGAGAAAARRAGGRHERPRDRGDGAPDPRHPRRPADPGAAGGARHGPGHGHRRPGHGARLRPAHRRRHASRGAARSPCTAGVSGHRRRAMTLFAQLVLGGLSLGAVYALLALGFVVVFKSSGVVNFAHPAFLMIGAYVIARVGIGTRLPFAVALAAGIATAGAVAWVVQRLLVRPMAAKSAIAVSIMTIGVDVISETEITR